LCPRGKEGGKLKGFGKNWGSKGFEEKWVVRVKGTGFRRKALAPRV